jgi:rhamnosyltransferase
MYKSTKSIFDVKSLISSSFIDQVIAVIVLYRTDLLRSQTFTSLGKSLHDLNAVLDLVIYDNSPEKNAYVDASSLVPWRIHYIHDPSNPGVSKAYNEGFKLGRTLDKCWLLLLDQDTWFPPDALATYAQATAETPDCALFAPMLVADGGSLLSPCTYRFKRGFTIADSSQVKPGRQTLINRSLLNSGLLISMDAIERIGGYNPTIRLDFADFDFIERYKKLFNSYVLIDMRCVQSFSGESTDLAASLRRFAFYCQGARYSIRTPLDALMLALVCLTRGLKLSMRFRTVRFLHMYVCYFLHGREP